jgi:hypothetical protein
MEFNGYAENGRYNASTMLVLECEDEVLTVMQHESDDDDDDDFDCAPAA